MPLWKENLRRQRRSFNPSVEKSRKVAKLAKFAFLGVVLIVLAIFVVVPLFAFSLPSPDKIVRREGFSTKILDRNGQVLYDIFADQRRTPVELSEIPNYLKQATVSIEDKNFYSHQGFDPLGVLRGVSRLITRGRAQGGSTLTQQLVKNVLLTSERTITRKIKEFIVTVQIERRYSKDEILKMYLNEAPYGGTAWGVEAAAETYFGKKVKALNLVESAFLAGLPQRPSAYSPYSNTPKAYVGRTQEVLRRMREDGHITREQELEAGGQLDNLEFQARGANFKAPHFVQYVQSLLEERYGERAVELGGLRVTTTLDLALQDKAQAIVSEEIEKVERLKITNGAAVVINPETGEILAMVGSKNFNAPDYDGQVNVVLSLRQPGSAIKPITYATALKKGYTASTMLMDVPTTFPGGVGQPEYKPVNYDGKYRGPIQLRYALANSINVIAVKTLALVGIKDTLQTAYDLGINSMEPTQSTLNRVGLSLTLGGGEVRLLELTGAYGAFMNEGYRIDPIAVLKVEDANGKVLEETKPKKGRQVLSAAEAFLVADILSDNKARSDIFGLNSALNISGRQVAVKTGTTNDKKDNWTIGGNSQAVTGVWVGNNDNSSMLQVASGVTGASPIWRRIILEALKGKSAVSFKPPSGIVSAEVDSVSGYRAHDGYPSRIEYFIKGTEPGEDPVHTKLKTCEGEEKEFFVFKEEDPASGRGGKNLWQEGILSWLTTQTDPRYHPPADECISKDKNSIDVIFDSPQNKDQVGNNFTIKFSIRSESGLKNAELFIDDTYQRGFTSTPYEYEVKNLADGIHYLLIKAENTAGQKTENKITIGVNVSP